MVDPITLGVIGTLAATEGIKFLFNQAAELIKAFRERKKKQQETGQDPGPLEVPIQGQGVLDATPTAAAADVAVLDERADQIVDLQTSLNPYATGLRDVPDQDADLDHRIQELRGLLEAVYGQRLTFQGEHREPSGTRVTVKQVIDEIAGQVTGVENVEGGDVTVDQQVRTVTETGNLTGVKTVKGR